jgi:hypothetical protein
MASAAIRAALKGRGVLAVPAGAGKMRQQVEAGLTEYLNGLVFIAAAVFACTAGCAGEVKHCILSWGWNGARGWVWELCATCLLLCDPWPARFLTV